MKEKLISLLTERGDIFITELLLLMPEIKGEYAMYLPVKDGRNPNVLLLGGVSQDFIKSFNELLIDQQLIKWRSAPILSVLWSGYPSYRLPIATKRRMMGKGECWLPIYIEIVKS